MFASLEKTGWIPDHVLIWPGHGAGSACGKSLGAVPTSTMGFERATGWAFRAASEDSFVDELLDGQPEPPRYFGEMKRLNRERPAASLLPALPTIPEWSLDRATAAGLSADTQVVDVREAAAFAAAPVKGAINVPFDVGMSTWFGWLLDFGRDIVIVSPRDQREDVVRSLIRIGLDRIVGWVDSSKVEFGGPRGEMYIHRVQPPRQPGFRMGGSGRRCAGPIRVRGRSHPECAPSPSRSHSSRSRRAPPGSPACRPLSGRVSLGYCVQSPQNPRVRPGVRCRRRVRGVGGGNGGPFGSVTGRVEWPGHG
jgi:rhodanese-related sulfurtransferase